MAGLTDRRGQMLLIGGVLLAVAIIALAIVFNSAVYTSVLAGESYEDVSSREPLGFQQEVRSIVSETVERAVREESSIADQEDYVTNNLTAVESNLRRYQADSDRIVNISVSSNITGEFIHNSTGSFVNETGNDNWDVGTNVNISNFSFMFTSISGPFTTRITGDSGDTYAIEVDSSGVTVNGPSSSETCSWPGSRRQLNITEHTVNGARCNALDFFERLDAPYDIRFQDSSNAEGRYSLLVESSAASDVASHDRSDRLFGVEIGISYHTSEIDWETTLRVTPGEPV